MTKQHLDMIYCPECKHPLIEGDLESGLKDWDKIKKLPLSMRFKFSCKCGCKVALTEIERGMIKKTEKIERS